MFELRVNRKQCYAFLRRPQFAVEFVVTFVQRDDFDLGLRIDPHGNIVDQAEWLIHVYLPHSPLCPMLRSCVGRVVYRTLAGPPRPRVPAHGITAHHPELMVRVLFAVWQRGPINVVRIGPFQYPIGVHDLVVHRRIDLDTGTVNEVHDEVGITTKSR